MCQGAVNSATGTTSATFRRHVVKRPEGPLIASLFGLLLSPLLYLHCAQVLMTITVREYRIFMDYWQKQLAKGQSDDLGYHSDFLHSPDWVEAP